MKDRSVFLMDASYDKRFAIECSCLSQQSIPADAKLTHQGVQVVRAPSVDDYDLNKCLSYLYSQKKIMVC